MNTYSIRFLESRCPQQDTIELVKLKKIGESSLLEGVYRLETIDSCYPYFNMYHTFVQETYANQFLYYYNRIISNANLLKGLIYSYGKCGKKISKNTKCAVSILTYELFIFSNDGSGIFERYKIDGYHEVERKMNHDTKYIFEITSEQELSILKRIHDNVKFVETAKANIKRLIDYGGIQRNLINASWQT